MLTAISATRLKTKGLLEAFEESADKTLLSSF